MTAADDQCLEDLLCGHADLGGDGLGGEILGIDLVLA
jgi:hypothetical protein